MSTNWPAPAAGDMPPAQAKKPAYSERQGHLNDDWHAMLHAVKGRLRWAASAAAPDLPAAVLDCADALDRLQVALAHEHSHRQCLERDFNEAQARLAQMRNRLHRTQAGERMLRHLAMHDPLTTLPNRSCFRARLDRALAYAAPQRQALAVMYIDLDGFKPINDRHGHGIGDEVLRIVALRLAHTVRAKDVVSRLGGDEFACLVADWDDRAQLSRLACKMFDAVAAPLVVRDVHLTVLPSIGIAMYPTHGEGPDDLLHSADAAMYRAKRVQSGFAFCEDPTAL